MAKLELRTIKRVIEESNATRELDAAVMACERIMVPREQIYEWLSVQVSPDLSRRWWEYMAGLFACINADLQEQELVDICDQCFKRLGSWAQSTLMEALEKIFLQHGLSEELTDVMTASNRWIDQYCALCAWQGRATPLWAVMRGMCSADCLVQKAAANACENANLSIAMIGDWRQEKDVYRRLAAIKAMTHRPKVPFAWLAKGLDDDSPTVRNAAARAAALRRIPNKYLNRWLDDPSTAPEKKLAIVWNFEEREKQRLSLMVWNCAGCENSPIWDCDECPRPLGELRNEKSMRRWLKWLRFFAKTDPSWQVRTEATRVLGVQNLPLIQDGESGIGFKKCLGGVILAVQIPKNAQIRKDVHGWRRASEAKIVGIEGDFYGEEVGISYYDLVTEYRVGDQIVVKDFDYLPETNTTGFYYVKRRGSLWRCCR